MSKRFHGDPSMLESERRQKKLPPEEVLGKLDIKNGDTLIDFGAGIGYFSIPALDYVGEEGKVIAIDISDTMYEELRKRTSGRRNIEVVQSDGLTGDKADIILLVNILHELDEPAAFLEDCFRSLHPGGRVAVIDWKKEETGDGPPVSHRIPSDEVIDMAQKPYAEHKLDDESYFLVFSG